MAKKFALQYRRKREGKTDYRKRLVLLKSGLPRLVIRASNKSIQAQLVKYEADGDKVLATARASELKKLGWNGACGNTPAAYLTGLLLAQKLGDFDGDIIVDIGLQKHHKGGRIYAVAKGAVDGGLSVRVGEDVFPSEERINGSHMEKKPDIETIKTKLTK
jgi:large subunit ribosomal protein L18